MLDLLTHFPELTPLQLNQFQKLESIYTYWNERINVISRKDIHNFYTHHLLHSLAIAKVINFNAGHTILDVGTGGGFPGIPLSILFQESNFTLIDAVGKKITVVKEVIKELELKNVIAEKARAEEIITKYNFIVSRAVASMPKFIEITKNNLKKGEKEMGLYYLKGGELEEELKCFPAAKLFTISDYFKEDYFKTKKVVFISTNHII